ncbi:MAG: hypothetical protein ACTSYF_09200 [Promethearchaeota archaeon]
MTNCTNCKFNGGKNDDGQIWCEKKTLYVSETSQSTCSEFENK